MLGGRRIGRRMGWRMVLWRGDEEGKEISETVSTRIRLIIVRKTDRESGYISIISSVRIVERLVSIFV